MLRCAVVGGSGYAGAELVSILAGHPSLHLASVHAEAHAGAGWDEIHPRGRHLFRGALEPFEPERMAGLDAVFLALPNGASAPAAAALHGRVGVVVDLSGDLRFSDLESYRRAYGREHPAPALLGKAVYGLPELFREDLRGAGLVACAGCYATAAQIAAAPALGLGRGSPADVTVSALSGTTGAGRRADVSLSFSEVADNPRAYKVGAHPHGPEIARGLHRRSGREVRVTFVPHLVPIPRGILATVVLRDDARTDPAGLLAAYEAAYAGRPFVRVVDPGERLPAVQDVAGTNFCDLAPIADRAGGSIVVIAVLDNLGKGAAGQAVQIANLVLGLPETAGLLPAVRRMEAMHA
jgi:N-acetyl-gamma-glutamyl-phosphate reductase